MFTPATPGWTGVASDATTPCSGRTSAWRRAKRGKFGGTVDASSSMAMALDDSAQAFLSLTGELLSLRQMRLRSTSRTASMNVELSLIGQIYDAALDPDLWTDVLGQCDRYFNSAQTFIAIENAITPSASTFYASIHDPDWLEQYAKSYMLINPMRLAVTGRAGAGDIVLTRDLMTEREYRATRFAREFLSERRITDIAVAILEMTATRITVLSTQRSYEQGFADEVLRKKLQLVLPHAQRAVRIAGLLEHHKMMSATMADTLDLLAAAVFLVTAAGGLVHANARGTDLLAGKDVASAMGISEATVRTHLKAIFQKTGTCRQADLVKLLAGVTGPLGPPRGRPTK